MNRCFEGLTRRERLAELVSLVGVGKAEGVAARALSGVSELTTYQKRLADREDVQVARAAELELVLGDRGGRASLAGSRLLDGHL